MSSYKGQIRQSNLVSVLIICSFMWENSHLFFPRTLTHVHTYPSEPGLDPDSELRFKSSIFANHKTCWPLAPALSYHSVIIFPCGPQTCLRHVQGPLVQCQITSCSPKENKLYTLEIKLSVWQWVVNDKCCSLCFSSEWTIDLLLRGVVLPSPLHVPDYSFQTTFRLINP